MSDILNALQKMIEARRKQAEAEETLRRKMAAAGCTENYYHKLSLFRETFDDQAGALAYYMTVASKTGDKRTAALGKETAQYISDTATWMEATLNRAGIDPDSLGVRRDMNQFRGRMQHAVSIFDRTLSGEDLSGLTAAQLTATA
jgi:hypothetical protein